MNSRAWRGARLAGRLLAFAAATAFVATAGFHHLFTFLAPWDDEGYLLISLQSFLGGERLYDDVYTQYGPFWFEAMGALFRLLGLEVSHDHGRLVTLGIGTLTALLSGIGAAWLARSALAGVLVELLVFRVVWPSLASEPMHPGWLACLLLACLASTPFLHSRPALAGLLQGALAAALLLVKINVGAFAALALATSTIPWLGVARRRWLAVLVTAVGVVLPFALMAPHLELSWGRDYAVLGALAFLGVALALRSSSGWRPLSMQYLAGLGTGMSITFVVIVLVALGMGSSWGALVEAVLVAPRRQASALTLAPTAPASASAVTVLAFLACVLALWAPRRGGAAPSERRVLAAALARLAVAAGLAASATGAFEPHFPQIGFWLAGFTWVAVLRPRGSEDSPALAAARGLVAPLAALQILHAYPVAGSQVAWSSFLLVLVAFLCALDGMRQLGAWARAYGGRFVVGPGRWAALGGGLLLVLVAGSYVGPLKHMRQAYVERPALGLPGAHLIHLPPVRVRMLRALVEELKTRCDTFVTLPGLNSLYLWAEREPPTSLNATTWMFLFDDALQERIVARLRSVERLCLVRQPQLAASWAQGRPLPERPLLAYLRDRFELVERVREYELWVRR